MNRLIALVLMLVCCWLADAQTLRVVSVGEDASDPLATYQPVYDINKNICGAVMVYANGVEGLKIKGNIVKDMDKAGDYYLVYLPNGTKKIRLMHEDYYPEDIVFSKYATTIKGGHTYKVIVAAENGSVSDDGSQQMRYLIFKSDSTLTKVTVNGVSWPVVKGEYIRLLPVGEYDYVVEADGKVQTGKVMLDNGIGSKVVRITFGED